jgi:hypothetical protein
VFVVVTLLVALGIAAAQGCQGPSRGLGDERGGVRATQQEPVAQQQPVAQQERAVLPDGLPGQRTSGL